MCQCANVSDTENWAPLFVNLTTSRKKMEVNKYKSLQQNLFIFKQDTATFRQHYLKKF